MTGTTVSGDPIETTFEFVNEPSVIHYTTDGTRPTESSEEWDSTGPREPGEVFHVDRDDDVPLARGGHQGQRRLRHGRRFRIR